MLLQHHAYTIHITSLSGCILQNVQRHKVLKLSLWQAFPISYRYLFPILFQRQKYMQYKQNVIDMKQWIFPYAEETRKENRFLGGQAHYSVSRHRAEQATRGSANTVGKCKETRGKRARARQRFVPSLLLITCLLFCTKNQLISSSDLICYKFFFNTNLVRRQQEKSILFVWAG